MDESQRNIGGIPADANATAGSPREKSDGVAPQAGGVRAFFRELGPGIVTGASDDDPSGIATYSQAGAQFGFGLLWTMILTFPLMAAVQEISARIGRITGRGIAGNIRRHYSGWVLYPLVGVLVVTNTINIGADIGAMGDAMTLLIGGPALLYAVAFALLCLLPEIFASYKQYSGYLKWLTVVLLSYVAVAFMTHVPWGEAMRGTFVPRFSSSSQYWAAFVAVLGTTISPYLFFWQASQETEEVRADPAAEPLLREPGQARAQLGRIKIDTYVGMAFSNLVAYFIILSAAVTLHASGATTIETASQAAEALRPLGGRVTFAVFALGIIGTGLLAVPVLAGSAAYAVAETMKWPTGLDRKPGKARGFYAVIAAATLIGLALNVPAVQHATHITPIRALFWSAVLNGVASVPILVVMMLMSRNPKVVGPFAHTSKTLAALGWLATAVMAAAVAGLVITWKGSAGT